MENTALFDPQNFLKLPDIFNFAEIFAKPYRLVFNFYQRNVGLSIKKGLYEIKTASEPAELEKALKLRNEVFYREKAGKKPFLNIDIDRFDLFCDHLIVVERSTGRVLGTCRLNSSRFSKSFYSSSEFLIENILKLPGTKLELGRACINKDYRNGMVISLIWRGICEYMKMTDTRYLFGCSSVDTTDRKEIKYMYKYFADNHYSPESLRVYPRKKHLCDFGSLQNFASGRHMPIPPLLKFYIKTGALICGEPALDKNFRCVDFFTFLDMDSVKKSVERRFSRCA